MNDKIELLLEIEKLEREIDSLRKQIARIETTLDHLSISRSIAIIDAEH